MSNKSMLLKGNIEIYTFALKVNKIPINAKETLIARF